jgi:hypothetical protein
LDLAKPVFDGGGGGGGGRGTTLVIKHTAPGLSEDLKLNFASPQQHSLHAIQFHSVFLHILRLGLVFCLKTARNFNKTEKDIYLYKRLTKYVCNFEKLAYI